MIKEYYEQENFQYKSDSGIFFNNSDTLSYNRILKKIIP